MKTKTIYRIFVDYEKEEKWLNEMAQSGWALESFRLMRYVFKQVETGTSTYRIELLSNLPSHPESKAYMAFLDEVGIEVVDTSYRWIFLRKRTSDGPFQLYSDFDSMIQREKRIIQNHPTVWRSGARQLCCGDSESFQYICAVDRPIEHSCRRDVGLCGPTSYSESQVTKRSQRDWRDEVVRLSA